MKPEGGTEVKGPGDLGAEIRRFIEAMRVEAALPPRLRKFVSRKSEYERIGGLTNRNYKLYVGNEAYVLRLPGRGTGLFIDRASERRNHEAAAAAGLTPPSLHFDPRTGVKITHFIADAVALDAKEAKHPDIMDAVAELLSRLHGSGLVFSNDFNVFKTALIYERLAKIRAAKFYPGFSRLKPRALGLKRQLAALDRPLLACHNDLVPENILATSQGLTLIDWEYSGMNDPAWDLASFCLESGFGPKEEEAILAAYAARTGSAARDLAIAVHAYEFLQDYLWSLWALLQEAASRDQGMALYYRQYGESRFERGRLRIDAVEAELAAALAKGRALPAGSLP
jgi:thiamine kinase-like enzyme